MSDETQAPGPEANIKLDCSNCEGFFAVHVERGQKQQGQCRMNPPGVVAVAVPAKNAIGEMQINVHMQTAVPMVDSDYFCLAHSLLDMAEGDTPPPPEAQH